MWHLWTTLWKTDWKLLVTQACYLTFPGKTLTFEFSASSQPCALKNLFKHLYKHLCYPNTKYTPISLKQSFTYVKRSTSFAESCQSKKIRLPAYFVFYCLFSRKYISDKIGHYESDNDAEMTNNQFTLLSIKLKPILTDRIISVFGSQIKTSFLLACQYLLI